ncbi:hypothetical protein BC826DRAFT_992513 [Russula brevipes]|nr:hypothetical protein BC826DRAFT_992513 [Russula brevipes]
MFSDGGIACSHLNHPCLALCVFGSSFFSCVACTLCYPLSYSVSEFRTPQGTPFRSRHYRERIGPPCPTSPSPPPPGVPYSRPILSRGAQFFLSAGRFAPSHNITHQYAWAEGFYTFSRPAQAPNWRDWQCLERFPLTKEGGVALGAFPAATQACRRPRRREPQTGGPRVQGCGPGPGVSLHHCHAIP